MTKILYGCDFNKEDHDFVFFNHADFKEYDSKTQDSAFKNKLICKKCNNIKGTDYYLSNGDTNW